LRLPGRYAFHVPSVAAALVELPTRLADLHFQTPALEWISTSRAERLTPERLGQPDYWIEQAAGPVRFSAATELALTQGVRIFVELGPGEVLSRMLTDRAATVPTFARDPNAVASCRPWSGPGSWACRCMPKPSWAHDVRRCCPATPWIAAPSTGRARCARGPKRRGPQRSERRLSAYVPGWQGPRARRLNTSRSRGAVSGCSCTMALRWQRLWPRP
jgi:hypothetical protein